MDPIDVAELMEQADVRSSKSGKELAKLALEDPRVLDLVAPYLEDDDKTRRFAAAETFAEVCKVEPGVGVRYLPMLISALDNPEPQTRWESLMALGFMAPVEPDQVEVALPTIVKNLHDEKSMIVRGSAALCLGRLGTADARRAMKTVPHLAEATERYGGGNEIGTILEAVSLIAEAVDDPAVRGQISKIAAPFADHKRPAVSQRVKRIQRAL